MNFNNHSNWEGKHAVLGASKYTWTNDTREEAIIRWKKSYIPMIGTLLHAYAQDRVIYKEHLVRASKGDVSIYLQKNGIPRNVFDIESIMDNLIPYVNDAIGFRMAVEKPVGYSDLAFGTSDAIQYYERKKVLRIHDLKMGTHEAKFDQLFLYAAFFFLEYNLKPEDTEMHFRIYQSGEIKDTDKLYSQEELVELVNSKIMATIEKDQWISEELLNG